MSRDRELYERAQRRIPGGTQLLSKRPELFHPAEWPAYYRSASGARVEDMDGRTFVDVSIHAVGACPLGFADPDVNRAVIDAVQSGNMCTQSSPEEVELAELLVELHPWAERVRYARGGGEAMAIAVRIARAATGHDTVLFSGYHGWHDWYLSANLGDRSALDGHLLPEIHPGGVPRALSGSAVPFAHGDPAALDAAVARHGDSLAAIVLEPARYSLPPPGYLEHVASTARRHGAVLVFDEITSGFRMNVGGLHRRLGVDPDIAVFAKAMSNGYPMGAVIGRDGVMDAVGRSFISSTYWSERVGPCAALATIRKLEAMDVPSRLCAAGERMRAGWQESARRHGIPIVTKGIPPLPSFTFEDAPSKAVSTLYTQLMLEQGFLASSAFYASYAHTDEIVDKALDATDRAFAKLAPLIAAGTVERELRGPPAFAGLRKT